MSGEHLRVGFLGNDPWSVPSLRAIGSSSHEVVAVVTNVPRPAGRGAALTPTAVSSAASAAGLTLLEVERIGDPRSRSSLAATRPDVLVVVAYGELLTREVLDLAELGAVNVHFSLLPSLRGASPVQYALLRGFDETGVTTMQMDAGLDTGPVLLQARTSIGGDEDAGSLGHRLADLGADLVVETLDGLAAGTLAPMPQDHASASWAPRLAPQDRIIEWAEPVRNVLGRIRALAPEPAASTTFRGQHLKVFRARAEPGAGDAPGTLLGDRERLVVAAADGRVELTDVALAGRRRMRAEEFVRGYRPEPGERLG
jgi:methionyl-tRNA formyltransferase